MKALAFITSKDENFNLYQYDKIIAALTFDFELSVVFMDDGLESMIQQKVWRSLAIYGVDEMFYYGESQDDSIDIVKEINKSGLKELINSSDVIL